MVLQEWNVLGVWRAGNRGVLKLNGDVAAATGTSQVYY